MLATEADNHVSSTNDSDSEEAVYRSNVSNVTMAETPLRQPISAFAIALRHSLCNHADYLYFSDTYLSHCGQEPNHISHQVGLSGFQILCDIFCSVWLVLMVGKLLMQRSYFPFQYITGDLLSHSGTFELFLKLVSLMSFMFVVIWLSSVYTMKSVWHPRKLILQLTAE